MNIPKPILGLISSIETIFSTLIIAIAFYITIPIVVTHEIIQLPKGSVTNTIESLISKGYRLSAIDKYLLIAIGQPKSGELRIDKGVMNRLDFLDKLTTAKDPILVVTLIPGETRPIFLKEIAQKYKLDYNKLDGNYSKYSSYKEAGVIPETYHVPKGIREEKLIKFLVKFTEEQYRQISVEYFNTYNKKEWLRYLTIASIVQKESANKKEMPIVASVIYNRLEINMPLQMDGTLNYGEYSHKKVTPNRIKTDKSKFNTYAHKGLPPYPICSVSAEAIRASIKPDVTEYLYFMKNKKGVHDFSKTYEEHLKNISRAKRK